MDRRSSSGSSDRCPLCSTRTPRTALMRNLHVIGVHAVQCMHGQRFGGMLSTTYNDGCNHHRLMPQSSPRHTIRDGCPAPWGYASQARTMMVLPGYTCPTVGKERHRLAPKRTLSLAHRPCVGMCHCITKPAGTRQRVRTISSRRQKCRRDSSVRHHRKVRRTSVRHHRKVRRHP